MESFGRERRHRYYTLAAYKTVMASENLDDTTMSGTDIDLSKVGDFAFFNEAMFYDDDDKLHHYQDTFKDKEGAKPKKDSKKRKRGETEDPGEEEDVPEAAPKAKRGRPRKKPRVEDNDAPPPKKRGKQPRVEGSDDALTPPTKRSRPQKQPRVEDEGSDAPTSPKKRDRLPKQPIPEERGGTATTSAVPKRRPPKRRLDAERTDPIDIGVSMGESMEGVNGTLVPQPVPPLSIPETSEHPPESQATSVVATDPQGTASTAYPVASEPPTTNPKEAGRSQKSSTANLTSSAVPENSSDDRHDTLQSGADPHVQAAAQILVAGVPQQAADDSRGNNFISTESHPPTQERVIIDPALMEPSFVSWFHVYPRFTCSI